MLRGGELVIYSSSFLLEHVFCVIVLIFKCVINQCNVFLSCGFYGAFECIHEKREIYSMLSGISPSLAFTST